MVKPVRAGTICCPMASSFDMVEAMASTAPIRNSAARGHCQGRSPAAQAESPNAIRAAVTAKGCTSSNLTDFSIRSSTLTESVPMAPI